MIEILLVDDSPEYRELLKTTIDLDQGVILIQINARKRKMEELWNKRGKTDQEVLDISIEIDELLNEYYRIKL